jgi:hypothetical protein
MNKHETIVAIDPGASGGLAISLEGSAPSFTHMPETVHDLAELLGSVAIEASNGNAHAYLEQVGGYVGGAGAPGSAMFNFGQNYGQIIGILAAYQIPFTLVRPQKWQGALSLGNSKGMSKTEWKNKLKAKAQQLFPSSKITLATADAALIWHAASKNLI